MRTTAPIAGLAALITITLAGCAAPEAAPAPTVTVTETVSPSPDLSPSVSDEPLGLGETVTLASAPLTVHAVNLDPAPEPAPQPASETDKWVSADVEICNQSGETFTFSASPWTLVDSDNRAFSQSSTGYNQFPQPDYAFGEVTLGVDECRRGWITFVVNEGSTLVNVRYQNTLGEIARWSIS